jgi:cellulose synthase/poly-beta-1,6-N-acetylglucosamine synthase-like glycosyltransferase
MIFHILDHYRFLKKRAKEKDSAQDYLLRKFGTKENPPSIYSKKYLYESYIDLHNTISFSAEMQYAAYSDFIFRGFVQKSLKMLESNNINKRLKAITFLSTFNEKYILNILTSRLLQEKNERAKTLIIYALKDRIDETTLQTVIQSLVGSKRFYQSRVINILKMHLSPGIVNIKEFFDRSEMEVKEVFVDLANSMVHPEFKNLLESELQKIESYLDFENRETYKGISLFRVKRLYYGVLTALANLYDFPIISEKYLANSDMEVVSIASKTACTDSTFERIELLLEYARTGQTFQIFAQAIIHILEKNQVLYNSFLNLLSSTTDKSKRQVLAHVLSQRIDYIILKIHQKNEIFFNEVLNILIEFGYYTELINFLNQNKDIDIEKQIETVLQPLANVNSSFLYDLNHYLNSAVFKRMHFTTIKLKEDRARSHSTEVKKTKWLLQLLVFSVITMPIIYVVLHLDTIFQMPFPQIIKNYVVFLNKSFIIYYLIINATYFLLAILSYFMNKKQMSLWALKNRHLLYEKGMIPSVSIIAPAYNEEVSIVESINSLLNLDYPEYEVIVVNDGSKDQTLSKVIDYFDLKRRELDLNSHIETRIVKAVYKSKSYPNLTLIDKENGGKADALNVGINYSKNEYVCGIDADSILESDALLKLMSSMLDHDKITIALGGSIVPVNGSVVDRGHIEKFGLPKNMLARFQFIEYLRAFNISRLGFSKIHSLLIISGAFGLFEKRMLINAGGYLTVSSLKKDTVGEDMELVVRVTKRALESHLNYRVDFISQARCFTEVPESTKSLFKQRNRWQRGLVDILSYHRHMIFNPKYKQVGMIGLPYFLLFEMIGPLFEIQAYFAIILGFVFHLLNIEIVLLLLVVTLLLGVFLSLFSLFISESERANYTFKDILTLVVFAIIENFGWRQIISVYRVYGYMVSLKENQTWGQMNRVGFQKKTIS